MEDQGIIALFFERSEQAIEETDKKYGGYCYSIAYNILSNREDSEESVSDTYLAAWNTIPPRRPNFLNAFLAKMTRHISIDRWRKLSAQKRGGGEIILATSRITVHSVPIIVVCGAVSFNQDYSNAVQRHQRIPLNSS